MAHAEAKKAGFKRVTFCTRFAVQPVELPLQQSRSANRNRFLEVYVYYCFVLRNLSTIETCQKIDHTIGMKIGLELLTQDKRNRIWAPIEKKIRKHTSDTNRTRAPHFTGVRSARIPLAETLVLKSAWPYIYGHNRKAVNT